MRDHVAPVLHHLHWLPVSFRIDSKVLRPVFKALHGLTPVYITDTLSFYDPPRTLRSAARLTIPVGVLLLATTPQNYGTLCL